MKILLTGYQGNLGSALVKNSSDEIIGVGRKEWENIEDYFSDDVDTVIHAAYDLKNKINEYPSKYLESNVLSTARLLELSKKYGVRKFVFISSCAVYGKSENTSETQFCSPVTTNGVVKLLNEMTVRDFCINNIKFEIYRLFNLYGGHDTFSIISHIRNALSTGNAFNLNNNGIAERDFVHVEDAANIIIKLIGLEHQHNYVNIGTGQGTKIIEIVDKISRAYPELRIKESTSDEVKISVANTEQLHSLGDFETRNILDYLPEIFPLINK